MNVSEPQKLDNKMHNEVNFEQDMSLVVSMVEVGNNESNRINP